MRSAWTRASDVYAAGPGDSLLGRAQSYSAQGGLSSSDAKRVMLWGEAAAAFGAHPLTGVGSGAPGLILGGALLRRGVAADPTSSAGYADLARLDMSLGELEAASGELRTGLKWNPHDPTLEGLWAYAAFDAQRESGDERLATRLIDELTRLPVATPDGWFWLAAAYDALGQTGPAEAAREHARDLAQTLDTDAYMERLK